MSTTPVGSPAHVPPDSLRARLRANPAVRPFYRVGMFLAGLVLVLTGMVLSVLPGPLTIPFVLGGLWVWSKEFGWAQRLLHSFQVRARRGWEHARRRPVSTAVFTLVGLAAAGAAIWVVGQYDLVEQARTLLG